MQVLPNYVLKWKKTKVWASPGAILAISLVYIFGLSTLYMKKGEKDSFNSFSLSLFSRSSYLSF